jgi:hypothetical protein
MTPGPTPKDRSTRRRRNVPSGGEWIDLFPLEKPILQELGDEESSTRARETWEAWRQDPATSQWSPADIAFASDTLTLVELNEREPRSSLAAEIRLRLDGLGLTPKGRRNFAGGWPTPRLSSFPRAVSARRQAPPLASR